MNSLDNKTKAVEDHLIVHGDITSLEAIKLYWATRLSSIIFRLKEKGYKIESIQETDGKSRYVRYKLHR
jgi:hypothetical protein